MANIYYLIKNATLAEIVDAINQVNVDGLPNISIPDGDYEKYFIFRSTLVKIADLIRERSGTTEEIPVSELSARLLTAFDNSDISEMTVPILGEAILGLCILGGKQLSRPVIRLVEKLATPTIELKEMLPLGTPSISLVEVEKLGTPAIYLYHAKLTAPAIYLYHAKLTAPVIYLDGCEHANYTSEITKAATCTTEGVITHTCTDCGHTWTETIPTTSAHTYESVITEPTCTTAGYTTHTCSACGATYTDSETDALGHEWGEPYYSDEFTTTGYGRKCSRCGELEELTAPLTALDTPTIYLEEVILYLSAPTIYLEGE